MDPHNEVIYFSNNVQEDERFFYYISGLVLISVDYFLHMTQCLKVLLCSI